MHPLLVFAVLGAVATRTNAGFSNWCGPPIGMFPFQADKFTGLWYGVSQHFTPRVVKDLGCLKLNYTLIRTEKATKLRMFSEWGRLEKKGAELRAQEMWWGSKMDSSVSHAVWKNVGSTNWEDVGMHSVIASDYTGYAIVKMCNMAYSEYDDTFKPRQLTLVLSRTPEMDTQSRKILESVAVSSMGDGLDFQEVKNAGCWK